MNSDSVFICKVEMPSPGAGSSWPCKHLAHGALLHILHFCFRVEESLYYMGRPSPLSRACWGKSGALPMSWMTGKSLPFRDDDDFKIACDFSV